MENPSLGSVALTFVVLSVLKNVILVKMLTELVHDSQLSLNAERLPP